MSLKYCPTCEGKVDSGSPFCPHCNKLKPKEGWFPVIVEPTRFKNITVILPSCGHHKTNASFGLWTDNLRKGYTYADWVYSDFYNQLEKETNKHFTEKGKIQLKSHSTQTIKLKIPYESKLYIGCLASFSAAEFSLKLELGSAFIIEEGTYQVNLNYFKYKFNIFSNEKGGYYITKVE